MITETESILEPYLKKICEQNEVMIDLLKGLSINARTTIKEQDDEEKTVIAKVESLTKRERQVIELIVEGMLNKQMAYELSLSLSTIEAHRSSIMKKMEAKNVAQLTIEYMKFKSLAKY